MAAGAVVVVRASVARAARGASAAVVAVRAVAVVKVTALVVARLGLAKVTVRAVARLAAAKRVVRMMAVRLTGIVKAPRGVRVIKDSALTRDSVLTARARGSIKVAAAPAEAVVSVELVVLVVQAAVPATSAVAMPTLPAARRDHAPALIEAPPAPTFLPVEATGGA